MDELEGTADPGLPTPNAPWCETAARRAAALRSSVFQGQQIRYGARVYLREIHIDGLKLLHNLSLDFTRDGVPRMWTVLVGRNGLCKTTILRAIALAASGQDLANELSSELRQSFRDLRRPTDRACIRAEFGFGEIGGECGRQFPGSERPAAPPNAPATLQAQLELGAESRSFIGGSSYTFHSGLDASVRDPLVADPLADARRNSLAHWFVAGYGVQRSLPTAKTKSPDDSVRVRLETLFDSGGLVSTDFADHLAKRFGEDEARGFADALHRVLLAHAALLPNITGFELRGHGGVSTSDRLINSHRFDMEVGDSNLRLPASWLSHGYQAILAWLADLVGHVLWEARVDRRSGPILPAEMEGLVLVDELDLHLHPTWQFGLIAALKQTLPRMQFVVTTHSPMLLSGLERDEIIILDQDPQSGDVVPRAEQRPPKLQTSSELLEQYFGVDEFDPTGLSAQLSRFGFLANNPLRNDAEEAEMRELLNTLQEAGVAPDWGPVPRMQ